MNVILKDTDFIMTCTSIGFRNILENSNCKIWITQFTFLDFTQKERYIVEPLINQQIIYSYSFSENEILMVYSLYNEFKLNITVSDASAIILAQNMDDSFIINRNGIFNNICSKHKVKYGDFNWFFDYIKEKSQIE